MYVHIANSYLNAFPFNFNISRPLCALNTKTNTKQISGDHHYVNYYYMFATNELLAGKYTRCMSASWHAGMWTMHVERNKHIHMVGRLKCTTLKRPTTTTQRCVFMKTNCLWLYTEELQGIAILYMQVCMCVFVYGGE